MHNILKNLSRYVSKLEKRFSDLDSLRKTALILVLAATLIIARKPSLVFGPQFWAEDGLIFYGQAYNEGIGAVFNSYAGFMQLYMRLVSEIATFFQLSLGPLVFSLGAIFAMLLPLLIVWSTPKLLFDKLSYRSLFLFTYLYLLIPHLSEVFGTLTNSGWYLAFAAALCVIRPASKSKKWLIFDSSVILISGLTGPYCLFLLLPAFLMLIYKKDKKAPATKLAVLLFCCAVQLFMLINSNQHSVYNLNTQKTSIIMEYQRPIKITGMRFIETPLLGQGSVNDNIAKSTQSLFTGAIVIFITGIALLKTNTRIRALILFSITAYVFSLLRAQTITVVDFWKMLQYCDLLGQRYFFLPFVMWIIILIILSNQKGNFFTSILAGGLLSLFVLVFPASFYIKSNDSKQYDVFVNNFNSVKSGTVSCASINPGMQMCLKKH